MKKLKIINLIIITLIIVVSVGGCSKQNDNQSIKIGAILPLTGDISEYGKRSKMGIDLATEEINSMGGINGKRIEIDYQDDKGIPKDGVSALEKMISIDKINIVIGAVSSSVTLAMMPLADQNKVILFSPASSSPKLTNISKYFFRDWPSDLLEATVLSDFTFNELNFKNVSILYVNNDYGIGLKNEFEKNFTKLGGKILNAETYNQGAVDFKTQLTKIKSLNPEAIYLAGYHKEMASATKQLRELGIKCQILGDADYGVDELLKIAGSASEGAIFSIPEYLPNDTTGSIKNFSNNFRKKFNSEPTIFEANGYDALMIINLAIKNVGLNTDKISEFISNLKHYKGASGDISFNSNGDVIKPITIKIVKNNQFVIYTNN